MYQPILTVGTSMAVTITHVFSWGSSATNHIENALMGSPCTNLSHLTYYQSYIFFPFFTSLYVKNSGYLFYISFK
jgi:hypothetical protein